MVGDGDRVEAGLAEQVHHRGEAEPTVGEAGVDVEVAEKRAAAAFTVAVHGDKDRRRGLRSDALAVKCW
ncbi:MAG: hypothetical protein ACYC9Y_08850 [Candidatus Methylomirabilia bacterium]